MAKSAAIESVGDSRLGTLKAWPQRAKSFYNDVRTEMRKVTVPNRKEVQGTTTVVIITVFLFGLYFWLVDTIIGKSLDHQRLSLKAFGRYVSGVPEHRRDVGPVALDPGGDLAEWQNIDWRGVRGPVAATVDPADAGLSNDGTEQVLLSNLGGKATRWLGPRVVDERSSVVVEPELIRRVGRSGALIEAQLADPSADTSDLRAVYSEGDPVCYLARQVRTLGPRVFARATGVSPRSAERIRDGKKVRPSTVRAAIASLRIVTSGTPRCPVDDKPVFRRGATYCSAACRSTARRRRQRRALATQATATSTGTNP